jgi:hypothetical protein
MSLTQDDFKNNDLWHIYQATLNGGGGGGGAVFLQDIKPQNTSPAVAVSLTWNTREINYAAGASFCTIAANQITFSEEGNYCIFVSTPTFGTGTNRLRLYTITGATSVFCGSNNFSNTYAYNSMIGYFVASVNEVFEIQHYVNTGGAQRFGAPNNITAEDEHYLNALILKV